MQDNYEYQTLMRFYNVDTEIYLIKIMEEHIEKLQIKLAKLQPVEVLYSSVREG